jgi:hypothetical protein
VGVSGLGMRVLFVLLSCEEKSVSEAKACLLAFESVL